MKKYLVAVFAAALLSVASLPALAADQDVAKITCKEFLAEKEHLPLMIMWIDGYMSAKSDNTVINDQWIEKLGAHMGSFCSQNPTKTIMQGVEAMK